jgi:hypothetical protein
MKFKAGIHRRHGPRHFLSLAQIEQRARQPETDDRQGCVGPDASWVSILRRFDRGRTSGNVTMIKEIIVNLEQTVARDPVRDFAISIAETFGAHIAGGAFEALTTVQHLPHRLHGARAAQCPNS